MNEIEKALKELEEELKWAHNDGVNLTKYDEERFNVIKQALTELKSIKETDHTEALKQVTYLSAILPDWQRVNNGVDSLSIIKQALTTKSKKEQAFDIANKKCVNMFRLAVVNDVNSYNKWAEFDEYQLTEEEFDLLKEVLNDNSQE
jgi:hypothetical protein